MDERSGSLFSYVDLEARVPQNHPLRAIRALTNATLAEMSGDFEALYARTGRPGIAPEKLLRALLLQAFYSIRSERQLMEQLEFNLLFRWFVGLGVDERVWDATVFTKNRERLLAGEVASRFLARLVGLAAVRRLLSREHFSVDGTLIEAWASIKSFRPVDEESPGEDGGDDGRDGGGRNRPRDFHGARWSNATHRRGQPALPQGPGQGSQAQLYGPCVDGEPEWLGRGRSGEPGDGLGRMPGGRGDADTPRRRRAGGDGGCRQGLRQGGLRRDLHGLPGRAACGPQHLGPALEHRGRGGGERSLSDEPGPSQAHRRGLRLGEDCGRSLKDPASGTGAGRLAVHPGARGLRSDPPAEASGGSGMSVETGDRPTGTLRTIETGLPARLRRDTRGLRYRNHETSR